MNNPVTTWLQTVGDKFDGEHAPLTSKQTSHLEWFVRGVVGFGIAASIGANVLHSITRPEVSTEPGWKIGSGAALSAMAPLVLFLCIEMVTRIPVMSRVLGPVRLFTTFLIGGFGGWVSYWHMAAVSSMLGEAGSAKYIYPLIIDGTMMVATISLIELGRIGRAVARFEQHLADVESLANVEPSVDMERRVRMAETRERVAALSDSQRRTYGKLSAYKRRQYLDKVMPRDVNPFLDADADIPVSPAPAGRR